MTPLLGYLITEAGMCFCIARHLGDATALINRHSESRSFYEEALDLCGRVKHRPELALSRLGLSEALLDHYPDEHDAAIEHLDLAIAEFEDMRIQPALEPAQERALGHRGLLKA